ncbi:hypothetical protein L2744_03605 [Shewanella profunda]|uniref:hypothetical protein n=1 Tax=Shewanella profunda TaxID=254793 RepID=UPI00200F387E|nr:hypothetical protein [Shewanella profunda]MCL1088706.1 hypothetical protein [Shewanella profunda]
MIQSPCISSVPYLRGLKEIFWIWLAPLDVCPVPTGVKVGRLDTRQAPYRLSRTYGG